MLIKSIFAVSVTATILAAGAVVPAQASGSTEPGTTSLAEVLTSDGNRFDRNARDYDIVTEAVLAVLAAKPTSPVGLLADGTVPLTAFIPNDFSFRVLTKDLTGRWYRSEKRVFTKLAGAVGIDAVESVLLYHVIPGATIDSATALGADGVALDTALEGASITVRVRCPRVPIIRLVDNDPNDINPWVNPRALDINKGNLQIAHGIVFVLRPADL
ncbi:Beta-Ig-H3/fasciclin [metagenome]|uniref:Beta-Ig-H3/fasciclin n=1 Tax=metagenome TaxID=256318 RepID=A0A2P2CD49_9ZZZZ